MTYTGQSTTAGTRISELANPREMSYSITLQLELLRKILEELNEEFGNTCIIANELLGAEVESAEASSKRGANGSLLDQAQEIIKDISARIGAIRYRHGRIARAIRG